MAALDGSSALGLMPAMSETPPTAPKAPIDPKEEARRKLLGRAMVIGLLLLTAAYAIATFMGRR